MWWLGFACEAMQRMWRLPGGCSFGTVVVHVGVKCRELDEDDAPRKP